MSDRVHSVSPEPLNHFLPDLVWWCTTTSQCVLQKNWFTIFNVKVTARAYVIKIELFLVFLLNCWSTCNQTWLDGTTPYARLFCAKSGLLGSRSRSRQKFKLLVNVCPDDIFWTADHFDAKLGMVMRHHKPECQAGKLVHWGLIWSKYYYFYSIFSTADQFATKLGLVLQHHKPERPVQKLGYYVEGQGHSKGSKC